MSLEAGTRLGSYEVLGPLGQGGMGVVYRARDTRLRREVALKLIRADHVGDSNYLKRFEREAQSLAAVNHPGIGTIHGIEEHDGALFLVLELVSGVTLAERLRGGPLAWREVVDVASQIADALDAAHRNGIIHRDLKPSNVMITPEGRAKVLDFGLAKKAEGGVSEARTEQPDSTVSYSGTEGGTVVGTAPYRSPEQTRGDPIDQRTDVWALGCLLYEALSGRRAFEGRTASDAIAAVLRGEPDWTHLPAELPSVVRSLLQRCLEKDASRRLSTCREVKLLLEESRSAPESKPKASPAAPAAGPSGGSIHAQYRGCVMSIAWAAIVSVGVVFFVTRDRGTRDGAIAVDQAPPLLLPERLDTVELEIAQLEFDSKDYDGAVEQAQKVLAQVPNSPEAAALIDRVEATRQRVERLAVKATAALEGGDVMGASTALGGVLTLDPGNPVVAQLAPKLNGSFRNQAASARDAMEQTRAAAADYPADEVFERAEAVGAAGEAAARAGTYVVAAQRFLEARDLFERHRRVEVALARADGARRQALLRWRREEGARVLAQATPPLAARPSAATPVLATPMPKATPTLPGTPTPSPGETAVRAVIDRYARAYEERDMNLLKRVWPSFSDEERLSAAFQQIQRWQVGVSVQSVQIQGKRATVVVDRQDVVNGSQTPRRSQTFTLVESREGWVIESVGE